MKIPIFFNVINFFSNKEKIYIASKINLITAAISILCVPLYFINPNHIYRWLFIHIATIIAIGLSTYFLKKKSVSHAGWTSILIYWIVLTYLSFTSGGVQSPIPYFYLFPILFSYLVLDTRVGLLITVLSLLTIMYMYFDPLKIVVKDFQSNNLDWLFTIEIFLITIYFIVLAIFSVTKISFYKLQKENARKRIAEKKLKSLNRNLKNILESVISVGLIVTNHKGIIKSFNKGAQNIFGYTPSELINKVNIISFFDFEELNNESSKENINFEFLFNSLVFDITENCPKREECNFIKKDTSKCRVDLTITPLYSDKNSISGYLFTVFDVTKSYTTKTIIEILNKELEEKVSQRTLELKQANESLLEMNLKMQKTLEELSNTQKYLIQSEKLAALGQLSAAIGHELNTPIGAIISSSYVQKDFIENTCIPTLKQLYQLKDSEFQLIMNLLNECREFMKDNNTPITRSDKKYIQSQLQKNPFLSKEDIEILFEIGLDYSKPKIQELLFYENISHIIKILHFFCQVKKTNQIIQIAGEKANTVLKSLRLYLSDPVDDKLESVYLSKEIEIILTLNQNRIKSGIEVVREWNAREPFMGNKGSLNQVWINLINNAIDSMNGKGILKISSKLEDNFIIISFEDNGKGIPIEIHNKIFEPFFSTKKDGNGTGLGLYICKKIIEKINGSITFTSEPNKTIFQVKIPFIELTSQESLN